MSACASQRSFGIPYQRTLGLGHEAKSLLDAAKLWLTERPGEGVAAEDVRALFYSMNESRDKFEQQLR